MKTLLLISLSLVFTTFGSSCKKKVTVQEQKTQIQSSANALAVSSNQWNGQADQIDPSLGKIKTLD